MVARYDLGGRIAFGRMRIGVDIRRQNFDDELPIRLRQNPVREKFLTPRLLLEAKEVRGRGQWCVVRQTPATGKLLAFEMGNGTMLSVGCQHVKLSPAKNRL